MDRLAQIQNLSLYEIFCWKCILNQNIQRQPAILVMVAKGVPKPEADVNSIHSQPGVFQHLTEMTTILLQEKTHQLESESYIFLLGNARFRRLARIL